MRIYTIIALMLLVVALPSGCSSSGGGGGSTTVNSAPVAHAGPDQNIPTGSVVTLNGSASTDPNGDTLTYTWSFTSKPAGSTAFLSNAHAANPTFTADLDGAYTIALIVNDGKVNSAADSVTITAATGNSAPVANAGPDQNVTTGTVVALDGSASSDANSDPLTYTWSFTSKPLTSTATLSNANVVNPTFTADKDGVYTLSLVVNDGTVNSAADTVTITATTVSAIVISCGTATIAQTITIAGFAFSPANSTVSVNDVVKWTNNDGSTHSATSGSPGAPNGTFDSTMGSGASVCIQFKTPNTHPYYCKFHTFMTGTITVN